MLKKTHRKGFSLIEMLLATAIFSMLMVSLYLFLRTGIYVREKIAAKQEDLGTIYLNIEQAAKEIRNLIYFRDRDSGFKGNSEKIEFYSSGFDYSLNSPQISHISYEFKESILSKIIAEPFSEEEEFKTFSFIDNLKSFRLYYFDEDKEAWQDEWLDELNLPMGVKIELTYIDKNLKEHSFSKHIFIYR